MAFNAEQFVSWIVYDVLVAAVFVQNMLEVIGILVQNIGDQTKVLRFVWIE